jgi:hypothetical protein
MDEGRHQELQGLADAELEEAFIYLTRYITHTRQGGDEPNARMLELRDALAREYARRHAAPIESASNVVRRLSEP